MATVQIVRESDVVTRCTGRDGRGRTTELPTSDPSVFLSVFTFHHRPGYGTQTTRYITRVMGVRHMPRNPGDRFSSTLSAPMSAKTVDVNDGGARFSAKALDAAHAAGVRRVLELIAASLTDDLDDVLSETPDREV
jgi:hypothetical protein